jgi:hypothetical protein
MAGRCARTGRSDIPEAVKIARQATEAVMNATPADAPGKDGADMAIAIDGSVADRLEAAVEKELRKVENLRAGPGSPTERSVDHERVARTLATLTETLFKVRRLRTSRQGADACGIVAVGRAESGMYFVLEDASQAGLTPQAWATRAVALYRRLNANSLVAEVNMGGEMVRSVLRQVDGSVPLKEVHASRGKYLRAEPVAALYEQGKVKHVGCFPLLEDEMCDFGVNGLSSGASPDRLDALVWAITAMLSDRYWDGPRITQL